MTILVSGEGEEWVCDSANIGALISGDGCEEHIKDGLFAVSVFIAGSGASLLDSLLLVDGGAEEFLRVVADQAIVVEKHGEVGPVRGEAKVVAANGFEGKRARVVPFSAVCVTLSRDFFHLVALLAGANGQASCGGRTSLFSERPLEGVVASEAF